MMKPSGVEFFESVAQDEPVGDYDRSKKSLAVVAADESGSGIVLWTVGAHVRMEIEEGGTSDIGDLGLTPPGVGIWVWEGRYVWSRGPWEHPEDGDMNPVGEFRRPTEGEWGLIHQGMCPWDDDMWKLPAEDK